MGDCGLAKKVEHGGSFLQKGLVLGVLGVEDAQGVALKPLLTIGRELGKVGLEVVAQSNAETVPILGIAEGA